MDSLVTDRKILDELYETVSWKDECEEIEFENRLLLKTSCSVELVAHCKSGILPSCLSSIYCRDRLSPDLEPGLIIWGNPEKFLVEEFIISSKRLGVFTRFIDIPARLAYSSFLTRALDGIDWQRSLEGLAKGNKKPVWSWDK